MITARAPGQGLHPPIGIDRRHRGVARHPARRRARTDREQTAVGADRQAEPLRHELESGRDRATASAPPPPTAATTAAAAATATAALLEESAAPPPPHAAKIAKHRAGGEPAKRRGPCGPA